MAFEEDPFFGGDGDPATLPRDLFSAPSPQRLSSVVGFHCVLSEKDSAQVYRDLLNVLALPFSPLASEGLQQRQVAEIAGRLHRYKDRLEKPWKPKIVKTRL